MKKIFLLSKENLDLAKEEVLSLVNTKKHNLIDNLLIADDKSKSKLEERLGYSHSIYNFLFKCNKKRIYKKAKAYPWQKIYKKNFCVRVHGTNEFQEKELAKLIYWSVKKPEVNLDNPKTKIEFFFRKNIVICGLFLSEIDKSFKKRRAHLRPSLHPTSMHPKLARACINITGLKKGLILDPFCGSGGILIEAELMGFKTIGYDIDPEQIKRAKKNLKYYKIKNTILEIKDSRKNEIKADAIVTDFPYGKGSKANNINELYETFLVNAHKISKKLVIIFPNFVNYKKIVANAGWKIKKEFRIYVHKSLTRIVAKL